MRHWHEEPPPLEQENSDANVCIPKDWTNSSCRHPPPNATTFGAFAFPRGMRWYHSSLLPERRLNAELGVDHARLPVSHTHTMQHPWQPGLWFFYMRGCSDFAWDMGRTLLVRNRCHLAVVLEQRAHRVKWSAALIRVAKRLLLAGNVTAWAPDYYGKNGALSPGAGGMLVAPLEEILGTVSPDPQVGLRRNVSELASALDTCARGNISNLTLAKLEESLIGLNTLDYLNAGILMHELQNGSIGEDGAWTGPLDTIQIANQCSRFTLRDSHFQGMCHQAVEIWDVRTIVRRWAPKTSAPETIPRPWSLADGTPCELSHGWQYCMACNDTVSERACRYKCSQSKHGRPSIFLPQDPTIKTLAYGQAIRPDFIHLMQRHGALGKANVWRGVWEKVLLRLPQLPPPAGSHAARHHYRQGVGARVDNITAKLGDGYLCTPPVCPTLDYVAPGLL